MKNVFINNFDKNKKYLLLIIIYNNKNIFNKFYRNLKNKIDFSLFNVVMINNNFPFANEKDDMEYQEICKKNLYTYINTRKNIGFLNTFIFIEKLFSLHYHNKHMFLFNCEMDSFISTKINHEHLLEIEKKLKNDCSYLFFNNEYWQKIAESKQNEKFIKMLDYHENENMTHVQCFFHHPYETKNLDKDLRYGVVKKTISDMIKENNNIYLADKHKKNFFIYNEIKENINFLKRKVTFEYFFYKRIQYYYYKNKNINYDNKLKFEDFLKVKKTFFIKKRFMSFIKENNEEIKQKNIYFQNKNILFYLIKKILKNFYKNKYMKENISFVYSYKENKNKINQFANIYFHKIIKKNTFFNILDIEKKIKRYLKIHYNLKDDERKNIKVIT